MKILQINSVCGIGSTGRIATDIHNLLLKQGHESSIAYGRGKAINCKNTIKIGNKIDLLFHVFLTRVFDKHGFGSKRATKHFIKKVKSLNPDIIHLHNIHGYYINIEILFDYLKMANKPVIWTLHDCWTFTGHCAHFDYIQCNKWHKECSKCPQTLTYPKSHITDNSKNNFLRKKESFNGIKSLTIVTPSKWLSNLVKVSYLREYSVKVINNGIDLSIFKPIMSSFRSEYNIKDKFLILGVASTWNQRKGMKYFKEIAENSNSSEIIVLVGLSKKQIRKLPKNIIGINHISNINKLAEIYAEADVFINPTLEDNFPTVNLEALACGTPVITFDVGGSAEALDENSGIIVNEKDIYLLLEAINKIREKKLTEVHCVNRATMFNKNIKFKEYTEIYIEMNI